MRQPRPPAHLAAPTREWWRAVLADFTMEPHHLRLLEATCRAWDRAEEARLRIAKDGAYLPDRFGQLKPHPALDVERKSREAFRVMLRELGLDIAPPADVRGPTVGANANLRVS